MKKLFELKVLGFNALSIKVIQNLLIKTKIKVPNITFRFKFLFKQYIEE